MAGNTFGKLFCVTTAGVSHGQGYLCIIDGCPAGLELSVDDLLPDLRRRRPGQSKLTTQRDEADLPEIWSGVFEGKTDGTPIGLLFRNGDQKSADYSDIKDKYQPRARRLHVRREVRFPGLPRRWAVECPRDRLPRRRRGRRQETPRTLRHPRARLRHPDRRYHFQHPRSLEAHTGGGRSHARSLPRSGCGGADDFAHRRSAQGQGLDRRAVRDDRRRRAAGLGEPVFDKLKADLGKAMLSLPAVLGFEYGNGFGVARLRGSENNDAYLPPPPGIHAASNRHGGMLGGISSGEPIVCRVAIKPTSSIPRSQKTVTRSGEPTEILVRGRHDPCLLPRFVPMGEAMFALVLVDHLMRAKVCRLEE